MFSTVEAYMAAGPAAAATDETQLKQELVAGYAQCTNDADRKTIHDMWNSMHADGEPAIQTIAHAAEMIDPPTNAPTASGVSVVHWVSPCLAANSDAAISTLAPDAAKAPEAELHARQEPITARRIRMRPLEALSTWAECRRTPLFCQECGVRRPLWRCTPCRCPASLCTACMRTRKELNPGAPCPICNRKTKSRYLRGCCVHADEACESV